MPTLERGAVEVNGDEGGESFLWACGCWYVSPGPVDAPHL